MKLQIHQHEINAAEKFLKRKHLDDKVCPIRFAVIAKKHDIPFKDVLAKAKEEAQSLLKSEEDTNATD